MSEWTAKGFTIYEQEIGLKVAYVDSKGHLKETAERNTRLIATAPELYEKLKTAISYCSYAEEFSPAAKIVARNIQELLARIDGEQGVQS